jgi:hypothetical protein
VAAILGVSQAQISQIGHGQVDSLDTLRAYAEARTRRPACSPTARTYIVPVGVTVSRRFAWRIQGLPPGNVRTPGPADGPALASLDTPQNLPLATSAMVTRVTP